MSPPTKNTTLKKSTGQKRRIAALRRRESGDLTIDQVAGANVRALRRERHINGEELANALRRQGTVPGWDKNTVSSIELGRRQLKLAEVYALSRFFDVAPWRFFIPTAEQASLPLREGSRTFPAWQLFTELFRAEATPSHDIVAFAATYVGELFRAGENHAAQAILGKLQKAS